MNLIIQLFLTDTYFKNVRDSCGWCSNQINYKISHFSLFNIFNITRVDSQAHH